MDVNRCCPLCGSFFIAQEVMLFVGDFVNKTYNYEKLPSAMKLFGNKCKVVQCKCGFIYSKFILNEEEKYFLYEELISPNLSLNKAKKKTYTSQFNNLKPYVFGKGLILDYGCGWGHLLNIFKEHGNLCYGYDISKSRQLYMTDNNINLFNSEVNGFNLIICNQFLEHDIDFVNTLFLFKKVISHNGWLYITVPDTDILFDLKEGKIHSSSSLFLDINPWEHVNHFTVNTLSKVLCFCGFDVHKCNKIGGSIVVFARKAIKCM